MSPLCKTSSSLLVSYLVPEVSMPSLVVLVALFQCWWWVFCSSLLYLCCTFGASTRAHRFACIHLSSEEEGKKPTNVSWTKSVVIFCSRVLFYRELNKNWLWETIFSMSNKLWSWFIWRLVALLLGPSVSAFRFASEKVDSLSYRAHSLRDWQFLMQPCTHSNPRCSNWPWHVFPKVFLSWWLSFWVLGFQEVCLGFPSGGSACEGSWYRG